MRVLFFFFVSLLSAVDFDCIIIGASPLPLCEAIYQSHLGKTVLVLDQYSESGGAWKSITACDIPHADMGCHQLVGATEAITQFLETYLGCKMVPMEKPLALPEKTKPSELYFSKGCYELIANLEKIISQTNVVYLLNHFVSTVIVEEDQVIVKTSQGAYSTKKVITVPNGYFKIEGLPFRQHPQLPPTKYWHLYLLIQDPTPPRFSYMNYSYPGISRCMNLTHFVELTNSGRQLFVFQTYAEKIFMEREELLQNMKQKNLIDPSAYILKSDVFVYEQFPHNTGWHYHMTEPMKSFFEILDTSTFGSMSRYVAKWQQVMKPFKELFP